MKKTALFLLVACLSYAQTFEEYKQAQNKAFSNYAEEKDASFASYLKERWKAFDAFRGIEPYEEPKPVTLPELPPQEAPVVIEPVITKPPVEPIADTKPPALPEPPAADPNEMETSIDFFGSQLSFTHPKALKNTGITQPVNQQKIAAYWEETAKIKTAKLVSQLQEYRSNLALNDWAEYLLIRELSKELTLNENDRVLLHWYLLNQLGYNAKVGYHSERIIMLLPVKGELFNTVYFQLGDNRYYAIDHYANGKIGQIYTYEKNYPDAERHLDFALASQPHFTGDITYKEIGFNHNGNTIQIKVPYSQQLIRFMQTYPQVSYGNYFNAPVSAKTDQAIIEALAPLIEGRGQVESVNIILRFVQTSFAYKTDQNQFGIEKVMFAEETIHYPYSDCEDRSIIFTYLVKRLLGLKVVGLKYSDHMAAAVAFDERVDGDVVLIDGTSFTVTDPTYINANSGQAMPQYQSKQPSIISTTDSLYGTLIEIINDSTSDEDKEREPPKSVPTGVRG